LAQVGQVVGVRCSDFFFAATNVMTNLIERLAGIETLANQGDQKRYQNTWALTAPSGWNVRPNIGV
jgi:hypothetical protein